MPEIAPRAGLVASVEAELRAAGREATPVGTLALRLADLLVAGGHTAAGVASLSRELRAVMAEALKDSSTAADPLDELAQRRASKAASA